MLWAQGMMLKVRNFGVDATDARGKVKERV